MCLYLTLHMSQCSVSIALLFGVPVPRPEGLLFWPCGSVCAHRADALQIPTWSTLRRTRMPRCE